MAQAIEKIVVHHDDGGDTEIRNLPQATAAGMPVRKDEHDLKQDIMTVAPGSTSLLSIDPATSQISISSLAITAVTVNSTHTTIASFAGSEYTTGNEFQEGDLIILTSATDYHQRNWIHNGSSNGDASDFTLLQADLDAADVRAFFAASGVARYDAGTGTVSVELGNGTNELGAHVLPVDSSCFSRISASDTKTAMVALEDLAESIELASTTLITNLSNRFDTVVGAGATATHLGSFTGGLKPNVNSTVKEAIQSGVDNLDALHAKNVLTDSVMGVGGSDVDMGAYSDTVTPDNASVKQVTQAHGTAIQTEIANRTSDVAGLTAAIAGNQGVAIAGLALRTQMKVEQINLTANTTLQVSHSFPAGRLVQVLDQNGQQVNPTIAHTTTNVSITSELDLPSATLVLIGH